VSCFRSPSPPGTSECNIDSTVSVPAGTTVFTGAGCATGYVRCTTYSSVVGWGLQLQTTLPHPRCLPSCSKANFEATPSCQSTCGSGFTCCASLGNTCIVEGGVCPACPDCSTDADPCFYPFDFPTTTGTRTCCAAPPPPPPLPPFNPAPQIGGASTALECTDGTVFLDIPRACDIYNPESIEPGSWNGFNGVVPYRNDLKEQDPAVSNELRFRRVADYIASSNKNPDGINDYHYGRTVDLVVTSVSGALTQTSGCKFNKFYGQVATPNLTPLTMDFSIRDSDTDALVTLPAFFMTFIDLDSHQDGFNPDQVFDNIVIGADQYDSVIVGSALASDTVGSAHSFRAVAHNTVDSISFAGPDVLDAEQVAASVSFKFVGKSSFRITFQHPTYSGSQTATPNRQYFFSGGHPEQTNIYCPPPPTPPPAPPLTPPPPPPTPDFCADGAVTCHAVDSQDEADARCSDPTYVLPGDETFTRYYGGYVRMSERVFPTCEAAGLETITSAAECEDIYNRGLYPEVAGWGGAPAGGFQWPSKGCHVSFTPPTDPGNNNKILFQVQPTKATPWTCNNAKEPSIVTFQGEQQWHSRYTHCICRDPRVMAADRSAYDCCVCRRSPPPSSPPPSPPPVSPPAPATPPAPPAIPQLVGPGGGDGYTPLYKVPETCGTATVARTPLGLDTGCWTILNDDDLCCASSDGRADYSGQQCFPVDGDGTCEPATHLAEPTNSKAPEVGRCTTTEPTVFELTEDACRSYAASNGVTWGGIVLAGTDLVPFGCFTTLLDNKRTVYFNRNRTSTVLCDADTIDTCVCSNGDINHALTDEAPFLCDDSVLPAGRTMCTGAAASPTQADCEALNCCFDAALGSCYQRLRDPNWKVLLEIQASTNTNLYHRSVAEGGLLSVGDEVRYLPLNSLDPTNGAPAAAYAECTHVGDYPEFGGTDARFGGTLAADGDDKLYVGVNIPDVNGLQENNADYV
jgi:hypothetical protein